MQSSIKNRLEPRQSPNEPFLAISGILGGCHDNATRSKYPDIAPPVFAPFFWWLVALLVDTFSQSLTLFCSQKLRALRRQLPSQM